MGKISPLDDRYWEDVKEIEKYFSEKALVQSRLNVEVKYLLTLSNFGVIQLNEFEKGNLYWRLQTPLTDYEIRGVKGIEKIVQHDVKAVELFLGEYATKCGCRRLKKFFHVCLTSEDVTNLAYSTLLSDFVQQIYLPTISSIEEKLLELAEEYKSLPMLSLTHWEPASPTTLGKEFAIVAYELQNEIKALANIKLSGKLNGAVGNYNAHKFVFPGIDWINFSKKFIKSLGLEPCLITQQTNSYLQYARLFHEVANVNGTLLKVYESLKEGVKNRYFIQASKQEEVGSSTMPHKINPIQLENSSENLEDSISRFYRIAGKLMQARRWKEISDSAAQRKIGEAFGYSILAYKKMLNGLSRISVNKKKIFNDLNAHPEILTEAIQNYLRLEESIEDPYSLLKDFAREKEITKELLQDFILNLDITPPKKLKLFWLSQQDYIGEAVKLTKLAVEECRRDLK